VGLPPDFDLDASSTLGLQIVRTLVLTELGGTLQVAPRTGGGTQVVVILPMEEALGPDTADSTAAGRAPEAPLRTADELPTGAE
jgi:hypothetical protein